MAVKEVHETFSGEKKVLARGAKWTRMEKQRSKTRESTARGIPFPFLFFVNPIMLEGVRRWTSSDMRRRKSIDSSAINNHGKRGLFSNLLSKAESEAFGKLQRLLTQRTRKPNERHSEQRTLKKMFHGLRRETAESFAEM